jgi:hypothetical protein
MLAYNTITHYKNRILIIAGADAGAYTDMVTIRFA